MIFASVAHLRSVHSSNTSRYFSDVMYFRLLYYDMYFEMNQTFVL
jgi:hypothetical protein